MFRVICHTWAYFEDDAWKLGPMFDCLMCDRKEKDLNARPIACPKCELTHLYEYYKREACNLVKRFERKFPKGWPLERMLRLRQSLTRLLDNNEGRTDNQWDAFLAECARLIISGRNRRDSDLAWQQWKTSRNKT